MLADYVDRIEKDVTGRNRLAGKPQRQLTRRNAQLQRELFLAADEF